jgi:putative Mn2+ efflux pump MntP
MTTAAIIISIIFILCLTSPVATRSVGLITADDKPSQKFVIPLVFGISQGLAALIGYNLGRLISHLFTYIAEYMVFAMMLIIAIKLVVDSMRILKGKMLYAVSTEWDFILLSILAAMNTLIMSLVGPCFMSFGWWFIAAVVVAGFLWSFFAVRIEFKPGLLKKMSFVEFSASVFMVIIACLYLFTDLI